MADEAKKKRSGCVTVLIVLAVLVVLGAIIGGGDKKNTSVVAKPGGEAATAEQATAEQATEPAVAPLVVTAVELARAYDSNEARAQKTYGDRPLKVTGTVAGVDLDMGDEPVVQLATDNQFMPAQARLTDAAQARATDLDKGQKVTLICESVSEVMSIPMLKECAFE